MATQIPAHPIEVPAFAPSLEFTFSHSERMERIVVAIATGAAAPSIEASAEAWLSPAEAQRITRAVTKRRREYMLGRYAAKTALAVWHNAPSLAAYTIATGAFDQPVVLAASQADVTLAHTADAAIAIAHERGHPMGVDLETVAPERVEVVRSQVAAKELPSAQTSRYNEVTQLFLLWSAKEALSKALRCGLTCPFEVLAATDVRISEDGLCTGTFVNFAQYQFVAWLVGSRTIALVCSRNAQLTTALPAMVAFTREAAEGRRG